MPRMTDEAADDLAKLATETPDKKFLGFRAVDLLAVQFLEARASEARLLEALKELNDAISMTVAPKAADRLLQNARAAIKAAQEGTT